MADDPDDDAWDDWYDDWDEDDEAAGWDCAWTGKPGDPCGKAGSEECDFECPYRDDYYKSLTRKG